MPFYDGARLPNTAVAVASTWRFATGGSFALSDELHHLGGGKEDPDFFCMNHAMFFINGTLIVAGCKHVTKNTDSIYQSVAKNMIALGFHPV